MRVSYEFIREPFGKWEYACAMDLKTVQDFKNLLWQFNEYYNVAIDSISDEEDSTEE